MNPKNRRTAEVAAAFHEVGMLRAVADGEGLVEVSVGDERQILHVAPVSAGHGRPQEVRDALNRVELQGAGGVPVVVADHFTSGALDLLRKSVINYLDDREFVFENERPFVLIRAARAAGGAKRQTTPAGLAGATGRAVQLMLQHHQHEEERWWRVTELADAAGVAAGTAQNALRRLDQLGFLETRGAGPGKRRRLAAPADLLDEWATAAGSERRVLTTTFVAGQGPVGLAKEVSRRLGSAGIAHAVTGGCAALLIAPHATGARKCEVWVDPTASAPLVLDALGAEEVPKGANVVVLRARTTSPLLGAQTMDGIMIANPFRVYADLLVDPQRGEEQAKFLREGRIGF